jgi:hypothetical protein
LYLWDKRRWTNGLCNEQNSVPSHFLLHESKRAKIDFMLDFKAIVFL